MKYILIAIWLPIVMAVLRHLFLSIFRMLTFLFVVSNNFRCMKDKSWLSNLLNKTFVHMPHIYKMQKFHSFKGSVLRDSNLICLL